MIEFSIVPEPTEQIKSATTAQKIRTLQAAGEDLEWYPTTDEILKAMNADLQITAGAMEQTGYRYRTSRHNMFSMSNNRWNKETDSYDKTLSIDSVLDVGAGDGRVFDAIKSTDVKFEIEIDNKYGIEKAKAQSDDLIRRGVFIIGRDFFRTTLIDKAFSVIFSNPPYSIFAPWCEKLLEEANFGIMYLVIPVRWENNAELVHRMSIFDYENLGEFDFSQGDRAARARVNLIRVREKYAVHEGREYQKETDGAFTRWIDQNLGKIAEEKTGQSYEERENALKVKANDITQAVEDYNTETQNLLLGLKAIPVLPTDVLKALGIDRKSFHETVKKSIEELKNKYWRFVFDMLKPINSRLTRKTRDKLLGEMKEFSTVDFNEDNIYSIIIWVINNYNKYTAEQIVDAFENLTDADYITAYKSNVHWDKDTWRYNHVYKKEYGGYEGKGKPERYMLDYRIVTRSRLGWREESIMDELIIISRSLGYDVTCARNGNTELSLKDIDRGTNGTEWELLTNDEEVAFSYRCYQNGNAHLKINKKLMLKFNVEVARLKGWLRGPQDISDEFDVSEEEAAGLWKTSSLRIIGKSDLAMLEFKGGAE